MNLPMSALMFVCPLIAAVILVHKANKWDGVKRLLKRAFDYKRIKHIPIIFIIPIIMLLSYGVLRMMGMPLSEPSISFLTIPILLVLFFIAAVFEEAGWMGYAVDRLQDRWDALKSGVILGSVWGVWHIIPLIQAHHPPVWIAGWFLGTVAARVIMIWLYNNTGKSMFAAILVHGMLNVTSSLFPNYDSSYVIAVTGVMSAIMTVIVAFLWGSKTLARYRYA